MPGNVGILRLLFIGSLITSLSLVLLEIAGHARNADTDKFAAVAFEGTARNNQHFVADQTEAPYHSFVPGEPKHVIVLTYQRSGSTFFSQMFNTNPDAFYMFEPIDSIYSALYGTSLGWNVPTDITNFWNGSQRFLPAEEVSAVSQFLVNLFTCKVNKWPTETVAHRYWTTPLADLRATADYVQCLRRRNLTSRDCHDITAPYCGRRFGEKSPERLLECNQMLWNNTYRNSIGKSALRRRFNKFASCVHELRNAVDKNCINFLKHHCTKSSLRAVKTVRATMDSMEQILQTLPNARVIHLIRDPRAVMLSRKEFDQSARSQFSNTAGIDPMAAEAMLYCRVVVRDIRTRIRLANAFPGRIYTVKYEDVVNNLHHYTRNVYRFIDEKLPDNTVRWILMNARRKVNGSAIASRWKKKLTVYQNELILESCAELFD